MKSTSVCVSQSATQIILAHDLTFCGVHWCRVKSLNWVWPVPTVILSLCWALENNVCGQPRGAHGPMAHVHFSAQPLESQWPLKAWFSSPYILLKFNCRFKETKKTCQFNIPDSGLGGPAIKTLLGSLHNLNGPWRLGGSKKSINFLISMIVEEQENVLICTKDTLKCQWVIRHRVNLLSNGSEGKSVLCTCNFCVTLRLCKIYKNNHLKKPHHALIVSLPGSKFLL